MARVVEGHGAGDEGEAQVAAPDGSRRHQAALRGRQDRPAIARCFRVGLVVLSGVGERGDLIRKRVLESGQRVLHARRGRGLREPRLMLSDLQRLKHPVLIVAGERERVVLCHAMKDSAPLRAGKGLK